MSMKEREKAVTEWAALKERIRLARMRRGLIVGTHGVAAGLVAGIVQAEGSGGTFGPD